jgi:hypothetical protein
MNKPIIHLSWAVPLATLMLIANILVLTGASDQASPYISLVLTPVFGFFAQQSMLGMIFHFGNWRH